MPIYEYVCQECRVKFEKRRAIAEADAPLACPQCGSEYTRRVLSLFFTAGDTKASGTTASGGGCSSCSSHSCSSCGHSH